MVLVIFLRPFTAVIRCTWDSFYTDISVGRILGGLESFAPIGVMPGFVIVDDGWQMTNVNNRNNGHQWGGRLTSFRANFKLSKDYNGMPLSTKTSALDILVERDVSNKYIPGALGRDVESEQSLAMLIEQIKANYGIKHLLVKA